MSQLSLFDEPQTEAAITEKQSEQQRQIERVAANIAETVLDFIYQVPRTKGGKTFVMAELQQYVAERYPSAPASPDRILRMLRQQGRVGYEVTWFFASLGDVGWVGNGWRAEYVVIGE